MASSRRRPQLFLHGCSSSPTPAASHVRNEGIGLAVFWLILDQLRVKLQQQCVCLPFGPLSAEIRHLSNGCQSDLEGIIYDKSPTLNICRQITIILGCLGVLGLSQSELNHCRFLGYHDESSSAEGFKAENCLLVRQFTASLWKQIGMPAPGLVWVQHYDLTDLVPMRYDIVHIPLFEDRERTSLQWETELQSVWCAVIPHCRLQ